MIWTHITIIESKLVLVDKKIQTLQKESANAQKCHANKKTYLSVGLDKYFFLLTLSSQ